VTSVDRALCVLLNQFPECLQDVFGQVTVKVTLRTVFLMRIVSMDFHGFSFTGAVERNANAHTHLNAYVHLVKL